MTAVIPCRNEQDFVKDVVLACSPHVDMVIVSDDASADDTVGVATLAGADTICVSRREAHGAGVNTLRGIQRALDEGADIVVTLDGDGQHNPDDIPGLIEPIIRSKADIVIGSRFLPGQPRCNVPRYRILGIGIITWAYNTGSKSVYLYDSQCCLRAFSREALTRILPVEEHGFGFSMEILIKARKAKLRILEVPVVCRYHDNRNHNSTLHPVRHGLSVLLKTIKWRVKCGS